MPQVRVLLVHSKLLDVCVFFFYRSTIWCPSFHLNIFLVDVPLIQLKKPKTPTPWIWMHEWIGGTSTLDVFMWPILNIHTRIDHLISVFNHHFIVDSVSHSKLLSSRCTVFYPCYFTTRIRTGGISPWICLGIWWNSGIFHSCEQWQSQRKS